MDHSDLLCSNYWCNEDNQITPSETKQWYLTRLIVQDATDEAVFLLIGETADRILTRKCSELYDSFPQGTGILPPDLEALCGQTLKFHVKLPKQNYKGKEGDFTVTNIIGLLQRTAKAAKRKLLTSECQNREMENVAGNTHSNPTANLAIPLLKGTETPGEEADSGYLIFVFLFYSHLFPFSLIPCNHILIMSTSTNLTATLTLG